MHRFYLPPEQCLADELFLTGAEAHHARDVVRLRQGERVTVLDGVGRELICAVQSVTGPTIRLSVVEKLHHARLDGQITLVQAVPKGKLFESVIQKATELGVARIVPLLTERVVVRFDDREGAQKAAKWQAVAREAIKQCGSPWLPLVEAPMPLDKFLERGEQFDLPLVASLQEHSRFARAYLELFRAKQGRMPTSLCVCIGPEGDFTPGETASIQNHDFLPITLGPLVLRTDTAAVYCLSVLSYELQSAAQPNRSPPQP